jgi:hypothetical protein
VAPPMPFLPQEVHGELIILAMMVYAGEDVDEGERVIAPFRALAARPIVDMLKPMSYPEIYPPEEGEYHPTAVGRTMFLDTIKLPEAETIVEYLSTSEAPMRVAQLRVLGGAMARVGAQATAFAHRSASIMVNVAAFYEGLEERGVREVWAREFEEALRQGEGNKGGGVYVSFLGEEGEGRVRDAYPGSTWERLSEIKGRYDPTNLFRLNHNILPATGQKETSDG